MSFLYELRLNVVFYLCYVMFQYWCVLFTCNSQDDKYIRYILQESWHALFTCFCFHIFHLAMQSLYFIQNQEIKDIYVNYFFVVYYIWFKMKNRYGFY